jgi:predicted porin
MKKILAFIAAAFLFTTPALAEDGKNYVGLSVGGAFNDFDGIKNQSDINLKAGHDFGVIRLEGDYDYLRSDVLRGNMVSGMAYVEPVTFAGITPFVGAGVGYVWLSNDAVEGVSNKNDWAYILATGASYQFTKNWELVGEYRYIHSEAVTGTETGERDFKTHAVTVGTRYSF